MEESRRLFGRNDPPPEPGPGRSRVNFVGLVFKYRKSAAVTASLIAVSIRCFTSIGHTFFGDGGIMARIVAGAALAAAAAILAYTMMWFLELLTRPNDVAPLETLMAAVWTVVTMCAVAAWPYCLQADAHPFLSLLFYGVVLCFPAIVADRTPGESWLRLHFDTYRRTLVFVGLAVAVASTVRHAAAMRPGIGGVDFFFYLCVSRDFANGATDIPATSYGYFPGVYAFWRTVIHSVGSSLNPLQWVSLSLLGVNLALVFAIVWRLCRSLPAATFALLFCAVLYSHFDGFEGMTEPLVTLPILTGLLLWGGNPLRGREGAVRALALGTGIGLSLYAKQQGGLLSLGAASMVPVALFAAPNARHELRYLAALPVVASIVFLSGIALERRGFEPIRMALLASAHLDSFRAWPEMAIVGGFLAITWIGLSCTRGFRQLLSEPWVGLVGFATVAAAASFLQFIKRPYSHYFMLAIPMLVISGVVTVRELFRRAPESLRKNRLASISFIVLPAVMLTRYGDDPSALYVWPLFPGREPSPPVRWQESPGVRADLGAVRRFVSKGDELLVMPPFRTEVHYLLETRSRIYKNGYGWVTEPGLLQEAVRSPKLPSVLVIKHGLQEYDWGQKMADEFEAAISMLPSQGFRQTLDLSTMTLWQRPSTRRGA